MRASGVSVLVQLYDLVGVERRIAETRRPDSGGGGGRVQKYLRTDCIDALCELDPADVAVEALGDLLHRRIRFSACAFGAQRLLAGCVPVATAVGQSWMLHFFPGHGGSADASLVSLPDGRLVCVPGTYEADGSRPWCTDSPRGTVWLRRLRLERDAANRPFHRAYLAERAEMVRELAARPQPPWCVLAGSVFPEFRGDVLHLLRDRARLLSARRRAATILARTWLWYEGAPHGPRGRYLCDLERGWSPADSVTGPEDAADSVTGPEDGGAARSFVATAALFADPHAYGHYVAGRAALLRLLLRAERDPAVRVRLRVAALCELPTACPPTTTALPVPLDEPVLAARATAADRDAGHGRGPP